MILQPERSHKNVGNGLLDQAELSCATLANGVHEQIDKRPVLPRSGQQKTKIVLMSRNLQNTLPHTGWSDSQDDSRIM